MTSAAIPEARQFLFTKNFTNNFTLTFELLVGVVRGCKAASSSLSLRWKALK